MANENVSNATLTVACKMPHGFHLDIFAPDKPKRRITVKGSNSSRVIGGYGITEGVPKDHWDVWLRQHPELPAVTGGLIFALGQTRSVEDKALEQAELRTGLEGLNPKDKVSGVEALQKD